MEDLRQSSQYANYLAKCGWQIESIKSKNQPAIFTYIRHLPFTPYTFLKLQRFPGQFPESALESIKHHRKTIFTIIEPLTSEGIPPKRYHPSKSPYLPSRSLFVDLTKSSTYLYSRLSENTRRILRQSPPIISELSAKEFAPIWQEHRKLSTQPNSHHIHFLKETFSDSCHFLISQSYHHVLSGLILLFSKDSANYYQTFTTKKGRATQAHAHLVWHSLLISKKAKKITYDFEGVFDPRYPTTSWCGFSQFKQKFGGEPIDFPGCFTRWF